LHPAADKESRAIQHENDDNADERHFQHLALASKLAAELNRERTTSGGGGGQGSPAAAAAASQSSAYAVPPALFLVPNGQDVASGIRPPECRTDLVPLAAQIEQIVGTAFSVPAALLNNRARFAGNVSAQLFSFNSYVASLGMHLSQLLTQAYRAAVDNSEVELVVRPTPLRSMEELTALFASGLLTREALVPLAVRTIGLDEHEAEAEVQRAAARDATDALAKAADAKRIEVAAGLADPAAADAPPSPAAAEEATAEA